MVQLVEPLGEQVLHRLYRARVCVHAMLRDRGYTLTSAPLPEAEFAARLHATRRDDALLALSISARTPRRRLVTAFFCHGEKVGIGAVRDIVQHCVAHEVHHVVLVHQTTITPFARARLDELARDPDVPSVGTCEIFAFDDVQINPCDHVDVPPHELLSKEEAKALLRGAECKGMSRDTLPKMLTTDAVARHFGARRGQIFRIRRPNPEGVVETAYRVVV